MQSCFVYSSPIGNLVPVHDGQKLVRIFLPGGEHWELPYPCESVCSPMQQQITGWLDKYFSGGQPAIWALPLPLQGTAFQNVVWNILTQIPYGKVVSYGAVAQAVARQLRKPVISARAVGNAVGTNPVPIVIPCHRVVGVKGDLTGFSAGLQNKIRLLRCEGISLSSAGKVPAGYFTDLNR